MDPASIINSLASVRANHLQMQSRIHELEAKILRLSCVQMSHRSDETESTLAALALELDTLRNGEPGTIITDNIAHATMRHVRECWILGYLSAVTDRVMHPISNITPCHVLTLCLLHPESAKTPLLTLSRLPCVQPPSASPCHCSTRPVISFARPGPSTAPMRNSHTKRFLYNNRIHAIGWHEEKIHRREGAAYRLGQNREQRSSWCVSFSTAISPVDLTCR